MSQNKDRVISHLKGAWHTVGVPTQFLGEGPCPISISSPCTVYSGAHPSGSCLVPELKGLAERDCIYASPKKKKKKARGSVVVTTGYQDQGWPLRPPRQPTSQGKVNPGRSQALKGPGDLVAWCSTHWCACAAHTLGPGAASQHSQGPSPAGCAEPSRKPLSGCQLTSIPEAESCSRSQRSTL